MTVTQWLVLTAGGAVIAWINWYFFLAERARRRHEGERS